MGEEQLETATAYRKHGGQARRTTAVWRVASLEANEQLGEHPDST